MTELTTVINDLVPYDIYLAALARAGRPRGLPFVEFLWDNYAHLEPSRVLDMLAPLGRRVAFHVMWSRFLDIEDDELDDYLRLVRGHVRAMNPVYVSEHAATFRVGNVHLLAATELDWDDQIDRICERVDRYQNAIGTQLLLENYGSMDERGRHQLEHLATIADRTGCGFLFDISNAVMAELNGVAPFEPWLQLLAGRRELRCHVGGHSLDPRLGVYEDSHAVALSERTLDALERTLRTLDVASVCFERAYNLDAIEMGNDMARVLTTIEKVHADVQRAQARCG